MATFNENIRDIGGLGQALENSKDLYSRSVTNGGITSWL
jgi:hypothetical protein